MHWKITLCVVQRIYFVYGFGQDTPTPRSTLEAADALMLEIVGAGRNTMTEIAVVGKTVPIRRRYWSRELNQFVDDRTSGSFDWNRCRE